MFRLLAVSLILAGLASTGARADLTLARNGRTTYSIVIAPQASATVRNAAQELADDLKRMSGAEFRLTSQRPGGPAIYVGAGPALKKAFPDLALSGLPEEGFYIQTASKNLALTGRDDRGTLYAVYAFLETYLGARWYSPDATVLPNHPVMSIPAIRDKEAPAFMYRDTDEQMVFKNAPWDAHLKLNGMSMPDQANLGGINRLFNGAENFYELVPPQKYFATHPEYYSLINGQRRSEGDSQLCLTNPDVLKIVTDRLVDQAKADPKLLTLGLSPNDAGDGECQCENCKASDAKYGAPSGTLIHFVNQVAEAAQARLPGRKIWVETLAYQYTEKPPTPGSIRPDANVLICLAPIHMCVAHPLETDPVNREARDNLLAWNRVATGHLQIWHYVTNFANYLLPFPDWDEIGADMAYYRAHGVSGMFCEGDYNAPGEMTAMRTWVMAHLFWNPHQEVWKLVRDFCQGYYGPAGPYLYDYLRALHEQCQKPNVHLFIYDPPTAPYLTPAMLGQANQLFDQAEKAVASLPKERERVREARLSLRYVELMRSVPNAGTSADDKAAFRERLQQAIEDLNRFHVDYTSEGGPTSAWIASMQKAAQ